MRLLLATGLYPPDVGGPATYVKQLEDALPARGIEVTVLPFRTVRHLPAGLRHLAYFVAVLRCARGVDVVYAQDTVSVGLPAALAALVARKTFLVRVPGDYAWEQARQRFGVTDELDQFQTRRYGWRVEWLRRVQRFVVRRAARVVVPSEYLRRIVEGWLRERETSPSNLVSRSEHQDKIVVIYSSVEVPEVAPAPRQDGFLVVSSGRRVPWKGFAALERVVAREPSWHCKLIEGMPRAEALAWVTAADVYVLNSTYEGLSHALVEAMALGTPVIATNVGGNPELIRDGVDGLLIPPKYDEALHAALARVAGDRAAARARAQSAKERARDFAPHVTLAQLVQLLHSL